ncbi:MAG TPA: hypothetical protein VKG25_07050 [Bryobacteraceae bacterium]|nr:hypothetical protein [Bryobacteraceae bacterium]
MEKLSRRQLALAVAAATTVTAQTPAPAQSPQDELAAAKQQNADNAAALAKVEVPRATEPAVHFRA